MNIFTMLFRGKDSVGYKLRERANAIKFSHRKRDHAEKLFQYALKISMESAINAAEKGELEVTVRLNGVDHSWAKESGITDCVPEDVMDISRLIALHHLKNTLKKDGICMSYNSLNYNYIKLNW